MAPKASRKLAVGLMAVLVSASAVLCGSVLFGQAADAKAEAKLTLDAPHVEDFDPENIDVGMGNMKKALKSKKQGNPHTNVTITGKHLTKNAYVVMQSEKGVWTGDITDPSPEDGSSGPAKAKVWCKAHKSNAKGIKKSDEKKKRIIDTESVTVTVTSDEGGPSNQKTKDTETAHVD